ncbi:MAG: hypothetical protein V4819_08570 [Verrucomicrobiota bacterium]
MIAPLCDNWEIYRFEDIPVTNGRIVKEDRSQSAHSKRLNDALMQSYRGTKLPGNSFLDLPLLVTDGNDVGVLHNMINFRIVREDIASEIEDIAQESVQFLRIRLQDPSGEHLTNYRVMNPLALAGLSIHLTDAKWWDDKVGDKIQHYYKLVLDRATVNSPIFRIHECRTQVFLNDAIRQKIQQMDARGSQFDEIETA